MRKEIKKSESLTIADIEAFPVWRFTNSNEEDVGETAVAPVKGTPVQNLDNTLVGTKVRLACGSLVWALIGNVDANDPRKTKHFLTLAIYSNRKQFQLARYFDAGAERHGPKALAEFLGLSVKDVFPMTYDITGLCIGNPDSLTGTIELEPSERLTREQILAMALCAP